MIETETRGDILVVDDTPANLWLLHNLLKEQGYKVRPATNGQQALRAVRAMTPDLILLDIMMPNMDGFEVCKRLKADERTRDVSVIFISALNDVFDKVTAFSIGGLDYITKPFEVEEVLARVHTHLSLRKARLLLAEQNKQLHQQNQELDAFARTVAHDLKNPLGVITGFTDMMRDYGPALTDEELAIISQNAGQAARKATNIIEALLLLAGVRKQKVVLEPINMATVLKQVQQRIKPMLAEYRGTLSLPNSWPTVLGYVPWVEEIWMNYLSNGLKYGGQPPHLELGFTPTEDGMVQFWVQDNGTGLSPEAQSQLFTEFTRLNALQIEGHGLGLSIVKRIIDKLHGQVGVESQIGQGSRFYFTLPVQDNE